MNSLIFLTCLFVLTAAQWPRWEERTLDCTSKSQLDGATCSLIAPHSKVERDPAKYRCRREPMPQHAWNTLAKDSKTRLRPIDNKLCQKYYTYGKYRDEKENEWYLWLAEPCVANLTTHCRFKDIPIGGEPLTKLDIQERQ